MWFLSIPGCFLSNLSSRGCSCCCLQLPGSPWMEHKHTLLLALLEGCWWFIHCETLLAETLLNTSLLCGCKNVLLCRTNACVGTHNSYAIERHFGAEHCWLSHSHGYVNMSWMSQSRFFFSPCYIYNSNELAVLRKTARSEKITVQIPQWALVFSALKHQVFYRQHADNEG